MTTFNANHNIAVFCNAKKGKRSGGEVKAHGPLQINASLLSKRRQ